MISEWSGHLDIQFDKNVETQLKGIHIQSRKKETLSTITFKQIQYVTSNKNKLSKILRARQIRVSCRKLNSAATYPSFLLPKSYWPEGRLPNKKNPNTSNCLYTPQTTWRIHAPFREWHWAEELTFKCHLIDNNNNHEALLFHYDFFVLSSMLYSETFVCHQHRASLESWNWMYYERNWAHEGPVSAMELVEEHTE